MTMRLVLVSLSSSGSSASESPKQSETTEISTSLLQRVRPVTGETIDDILGKADRYWGHSHLCNDIPINKMDFNVLFMVIVNYDTERNNSACYLQANHGADEIDFLLDELAFRGVNILRDKNVSAFAGEPGVNSTDLVMVLDAIGKSKYLASHPSMVEFMNYGTALWQESLKRKPNQAAQSENVAPELTSKSTLSRSR